MLKSCVLACCRSLLSACRARWPPEAWAFGLDCGGCRLSHVFALGRQRRSGARRAVISCAGRTSHTGLKRADVEAAKTRLADALYARSPAGVGSTGVLHR